MQKTQKIHNLINRNKLVHGVRFLTILYVLTALLGWVLETLFFAAAYDTWCDRGFVVIPMVPVYGLVAVLIYLILGSPHTRWWAKLTHKTGNKIWSYILVYALYYIMAVVVATVAEFSGGIFLDKIIGVKMWTYHTYPHNFMGYICLKFSLTWGLIISLYMTISRKVIENLCVCYGLTVVENLALALTIFSAADFITCGIFSFITGKRLSLLNLFNGKK